MMRRCNFLIAVRWPVKSLLHYQQSNRAFFFKHLENLSRGRRRRVDTTAPYPTPSPLPPSPPENEEQGLGKKWMKKRDQGEWGGDPR